MSKLPDAVLQSPACGACGSETSHDGDHFYCEDCQLGFNTDDLSAFFLNPDTEPCGFSCDNYWHGNHIIQQGQGYDCGTCMLPAGHESMHWSGCQPKQVV